MPCYTTRRTLDNPRPIVGVTPTRGWGCGLTGVRLCHDAIKIVHTTLVTTHAWPELRVTHLSEYSRDVLLKAAKALQKNEHKYADIRARLKKDEKFTMILGRLVIDRLASIHGPARLRGIDHIAIFQLGVGDLCVERVQVLAASGTYQFWIIRAKEPYLNPGLIEVLRTTFFATSTSFGYKYQIHYKSSHPTRLEPELTAPLVALAATGLYAGLHAWQSGRKVDSDFDGDIFKPIFDHHLEEINNLKADNPIAYHVLMNMLYSKVIEQQTTADIGKKQRSALAVADLSAFV
ncbi:hypothetical protein HYPSUDRAFT_58624 [Hypholoma sublateritium FD-334 SS-4]|uniref:DUF6532 domain-containing protein n=1 Tax=Hypholoma sublateritium (strain FD-334 SS-4) TaxID=945553 RepID=A0A0D2KMH3_HYPSF|nr:hypothetical protein HYPSUDRAFT_58624 [Hypholoma sublateritium FD-334 SS-4]